jgi:hypothetical protein
MRLAIAVSALLVACGSDGVTIESSSSNYCSQIADVACHNLYQCCTEGEIEGYLGVSDPRTEDQCRDDVTRICTRDSAAVEDSLQAKRVTFDSAKMNMCLASILAPDGVCTDIVTELPWKMACMNTAFIGTVPPGSACLFAFDCEGYPDATCAPDQKCVQKPTAGFPCGTGCASDYYCNAGICASRAPLGAPCQSSDQCAKELFCDTTATPMPICTAGQPGGSACTSDAACESGNCVPGQCMGTLYPCYMDTDCTGHCADDNSSCTQASDCSPGNCSVGGNTCYNDSYCTAGSGDHCVYPVQCTPGSCIGEPVCTALTLSVDYCNAVSQLPVP